MTRRASRPAGRADEPAPLGDEHDDLSDFFDHAAIPMHWVDGNGVILRANDAELALLGYRREEYVGQKIARFHADGDVIRDILERLEQKETLRDYPARMLCKDGSIRHVRITSNVKWRGDEFVHTRCITRDVEPSETMQALKEQAADYVEHLLEGFVAYDAGWRMTHMNAAAERLLGRRREDVLGKTWHEAFPHAVGSAVDRMYRRVMASGAGEKMELFYQHYGRWLEIGASPVRSGGIAVCFRDTSDLHRRDETRNRLAAIVESSDDAIVSKSLDGIIQSWNKGAERIFGWTADEAVGHPITLIIPPELQDEEREFIARLRRGLRIEHYDTVRVAKDGRRLDISLTISPVRNADGRIIGASKVARDITERKRAEAALRDSDRRKGEFLAVLAHELRNPLAPIQNCLDLMTITETDPEGARRARDIMTRQVKQIVRLVDDLLEISRIDQGKIELRREPLDLSAVMLSAVETSRPAIEAGKHTLNVTLATEPLPVNGDPVRLSQVVANLLNNAAKFTDPGGTIALRVRREAEHAEIEVQDSGIGIDAETLPRLFEMFSQGAQVGRRSSSGLGIGLALARSLVTLHGGRIDARSDGPGKGAVFTVRLPLASALAAEKPQQQAAPPSRAAAHKRVLVVDDNADAAEALAMMLKSMGHEAYTATDGRIGLAMARAARPDVVLLDIGMPGLDGFEAVRRLRADPEGRAIRVVAVTGFGRTEDVRRSAEAGFDEHLVKPVTPELLRIAVEN
ncbi:MAG TPA: PAS domain S-box protein [Burkholderiales bacterium]|nr:PAS domain S-box protein [Burkholderiales bacterium]